MSGFKSACRVRVNAAGDWELLPPAGQITRIGNAGVPVWAANEDDLFIGGHLEVGDNVYGTGVGATAGIEAFEVSVMAGAFIYLRESLHQALAFFPQVTEEITVPVGQGAAGVWGAECLNPGDSIILGVVTRITQSPGGGAALVSAGRAVNIDEYLDDGTVALGDTSTSAADGDGVNAGPIHNDTDRVMKITTDVDVTISDMKIRVTTFYINLFPPED